MVVVSSTVVVGAAVVLGAVVVAGSVDGVVDASGSDPPQAARRIEADSVVIPTAFLHLFMVCDFTIEPRFLSCETPGRNVTHRVVIGSDKNRKFKR